MKKWLLGATAGLALLYGTTCTMQNQKFESAEQTIHRAAQTVEANQAFHGPGQNGTGRFFVQHDDGGSHIEEDRRCLYAHLVDAKNAYVNANHARTASALRRNDGVVTGPNINPSPNPRDWALVSDPKEAGYAQELWRATIDGMRVNGFEPKTASDGRIASYRGTHVYNLERPTSAPDTLIGDLEAGDLADGYVEPTVENFFHDDRAEQGGLDNTVNRVWLQPKSWLADNSGRISLRTRHIKPEGCYGTHVD